MNNCTDYHDSLCAVPGVLLAFVHFKAKNFLADVQTQMLGQDSFIYLTVVTQSDVRGGAYLYNILG